MKLEITLILSAIISHIMGPRLLNMDKYNLIFLASEVVNYQDDKISACKLV